MTDGQKKTPGVATTSLVLGILGLVLACLGGVLFAIPAVICGHVAKSKIKKSAGELGGDGLALAGLIMGYVSIGLTVVLLVPMYAAIALPAVAKARDAARRTACINNLRQIDGAKHAYSLEYGTNEALTWDTIGIYLRDMTNKLYCPAAATEDQIYNRSYEMNPLGTDPKCRIRPAQHDLRWKPSGD